MLRGGFQGAPGVIEREQAQGSTGQWPSLLRPRWRPHRPGVPASLVPCLPAAALALRRQDLPPPGPGSPHPAPAPAGEVLRCVVRGGGVHEVPGLPGACGAQQPAPPGPVLLFSCLALPSCPSSSSFQFSEEKQSSGKTLHALTFILIFPTSCSLVEAT